MLSSELYARSQGAKCEGSEHCHWCYGPCSQKWTHDDIPFRPFSKSTQLPRFPQGHWVCVGCWLWRRGSLTVNFLGKGYKDKQQNKNHSWLITEGDAWGLSDQSGELLFDKLLRPTGPFSLSITTEAGRVPNLIHLMAVNDMHGSTAETNFNFTIDFALLNYTVYELEEALKHGPDGKSPGVHELWRLFHKEPIKLSTPEEPIPVLTEPRGVGRPAVSSEKLKGRELQRMKRPLK